MVDESTPTGGIFRAPGRWIRRFLAGRSEARRAEAALVEAIEAVVKGTEPRLRAIGGYRAKLEDSVRGALEYCDELVAQIPPAVPVRRELWRRDPMSRALFVNPDEMQLLFSRSRELRRFLETGEGRSLDETYVAVGVSRTERQVLGHELEGDQIRRDVPQTTVSFTEPKVRGPSATEAGLRMQVRERAFNELIHLALVRILGLRARMDGLEEEAQMLQLRLKMLEREADGLEAMMEGEEPRTKEVDEIRRRLSEGGRHLTEARASIGSLDDILHEINSVLGHPEEHIRWERRSVRVDQMNIKVRDEDIDRGQEVQLVEFTVGRRRPRAVFLVTYPRDEMLSRQELVKHAQEFLDRA